MLYIDMYFIRKLNVINKRFYFLLFIIFAVFNSAYSFAECASTSCVGVVIENLYIRANGSILVITSGDESQLTCSGTDGTYFTLDTSSTNSNLIYSALLAAQTANKQIQINTSKDSVGCVISRIEYGKFD